MVIEGKQVRREIVVLVQAGSIPVNHPTSIKPIMSSAYWK